MKFGTRTFVFGIVALFFLSLGLGLCLWQTTVGALVFSAFATAVVAVVALVAGRNSVDALAMGTGVKGAIRTLMTDAKPGEPPPAAGGTP